MGDTIKDNSDSNRFLVLAANLGILGYCPQRPTAPCYACSVRKTNAHFPQTSPELALANSSFEKKYCRPIIILQSVPVRRARCTQSVFDQGSALDPDGELTALPGLPSWLSGPSPKPNPTACGASSVSPALTKCKPITAKHSDSISLE